ncbi:MAG: hypothetical protein B6D61_02345 [Bacteroidetes bacterium 4484_249]|nr:MAG: hypothetical protein B6D61_02345 [Bacteroidetes bacterium 4484_249]
MKIENVIIVDDHDLILHGIENALLQFRPEINITLKKNCDDAFNQIKNVFKLNNKFDLLITDLSFDDLNYSVNLKSGEELIQEIRNQNIPIKIIVTTRHNETGKIVTIIDNFEPDGYILKSNYSSLEICQAIEHIEQYSKFYSHEVHIKLRNRIMVDKEIDNADIVILKLLPEAETVDSMVGKVLKPGGRPFSKRTIEYRLEKLKDKLEAVNNTDLFLKAKELGIIK